MCASNVMYNDIEVHQGDYRQNMVTKYVCVSCIYVKVHGIDNSNNDEYQT